MSRQPGPRRACLSDLVGIVRSARAAVQRRQSALAIHMLATAAFEVGAARNRFGSNAATEGLRRSVCRMERVVVEAFAGAGGAQ
jgi:hypothetical protein